MNSPRLGSLIDLISGTKPLARGWARQESLRLCLWLLELWVDGEKLQRGYLDLLMAAVMELCDRQPDNAAKPQIRNGSVLTVALDNPLVATTLT